LYELRKPISYRKHYLDLKSTEEADAFGRIVPKGVKLPELEKRTAGLWRREMVGMVKS
jgi:hypothetical protein